MVEISKFKKSAIQQLKERWSIPLIAFFIAYGVKFLFSLLSFLFPKFFSNNSWFNLFEAIISYIVIFAAYRISLLLTQTDRKLNVSDYKEGYQNKSQPVLAAFWSGLWLLIWLSIVVAPALIYIYNTDTNFPGPNIPSAESFSSPLTFFQQLIANFSTLPPIVWIIIIASSVIIIIKTMQYQFVNFIIAENRKLSVIKALKFSIEFMKGNLLHFFLLNLSFAGWFILVKSFNLLTFPLHNIMPYKPAWIINEFLCYAAVAIYEIYYNTTRANFYLDAKSKAIEKAKINAQEIYNSNQNYFNNNSVDFENPKEIEDLIDRLYYSNNISSLNETTKIVLIQIIKENKNA